MCGAADAVKESVAAHNRAAAAAADADADVMEDLMFSEGGGSERWLHEYKTPASSFTISAVGVIVHLRCVADPTQPQSYWCVRA